MGIYILFLLVSFGASIIGAICGIGGGVIIKPVLDAFGVLSVGTISFLSSCTVLSMSCYSVVRSKTAGDSGIDVKTGTPLAIGAAAGGVAGKMMFQYLSGLFTDAEMVGAIQAGCLMIITVGTLIYTIKKDKIKTHRMTNLWVCLAIGLILGIMSSFLGIGGGPVNLVVLFYFFSMDTKTAAANSLYIILFSQIASLLNTLLTRTVPDFDALLLIMMIIAGILGGMSGRAINKKIDSKTVDKLFIWLMVVLIVINVYNVYRFLT